MKRALWIGIWLVLAAIIFLSFVRPHEMVSPGNLVAAHSALQDDCFACHAPFQGASNARCLGCHVLAEIGLRTPRGIAIRRGERRPAFHQALIEPDCLACHSDHPRPRLTQENTVAFDHALLKADARANCRSCHVPPNDALHRGTLPNCSTCHQTAHWKPATFDHDHFFKLDRDHNTSCTTCHVGGNYKRYTCYGCHEHQQASIIAEHREEGITNIENCVRCHRNAVDEPEREREAGDRED